MSDLQHHRILVVRLGAMGDILHALPAVSALRAAHPDWTIDWAVEPQWRSLLAASSSSSEGSRSAAQPLVDHIHLVPAKQWARHPLSPATVRSMLGCRAALRRARYGVALDLQGAVRSAVIASWAHPVRLLGEAQPREPFARFLFTERIGSTAPHVIEQAADVVRALAGDPLPLTLPELPYDTLAAQWCSEAGAHPNLGPAILLHPGAGWGAKRWPVERYAQLGAILSRETGHRILIHAAPSEVELGAALASQLRALRVDPLLLSPTVGQLIELTRRATLAIGGDTGPLHLAAALGKPTIGIFGPTDPLRNGPFHGDFRTLRNESSRRNHARHNDPEAGLLRISPESVAEATLSLLAAAKGSTPQERDPQ